MYNTCSAYNLANQTLGKYRDYKWDELTIALFKKDFEDLITKLNNGGFRVYLDKSGHEVYSIDLTLINGKPNIRLLHD